MSYAQWQHLRSKENDDITTLRDYFAAYISSTILSKAIDTESYEDVARWAYKFADAMIKERNKT